MELTEIYLRTMFDMVAQEPFEHLHWGLFTGVPKTPEHFREAQQAYADRIVSLIPDEVRSVVDVGCGLGGIARQVAGTGREVLAITPRADHAEALREATQVFETMHGRFEDVEPNGVADLLLFAESLSFFDVADVIERSPRWLKPGGFVLAAELMTETTAAALRAAGEVVHDEDITDAVRFTVQVLQHRLDRYARPFRRGLFETLAAQNPELASAVKLELEAVPNEALRRLLLGTAVEGDMLDDRRYRVLLVRVQAQK